MHPIKMQSKLEREEQKSAGEQCGHLIEEEETPSGHAIGNTQTLWHLNDLKTVLCRRDLYSNQHNAS